MKKYLLVFIICCIGTRAYAVDIGGYLFVTFRGEATPMTEQIYFMLSKDGHKWSALNQENPVLVSALGEKGVRDPFIIRSHDNKKFYIIATDLSINLNSDWGRAQTAGSQSIVIWESEDLVSWSAPRIVKIAPDNAGCTWAPEAVYDEKNKDYLVFWASKTADDGYSKQRIWAARTKDFITFGKPFIYIEKPNTVIDTTIVKEGENFYRFTKDEQDKSITMETSKYLMSDWKSIDKFSLSSLQGYEGPTSFMIKQPEADKPPKWRLLLDFYSQGKGYQTFETDNLSSGDFKHGDPMSFPFHPVRHGAVLTLSNKEYNRLSKVNENKKWGAVEGVVKSSASPWVKKNNIVIDEDTKAIFLPLTPDAELTSFDPEFILAQGMNVSPKGKQDFSKGSVDYEINVNGELKKYKVTVEIDNNPIISGYYADPEIIYSKKDGKYYLYPTSDGFPGWSGTYFKSFSSPDLVHWHDEGVILDLKKDVSWANRNAWAPTLIEKNVGEKYKYYFYFVAAQKIGVAVADNPAGPFADLGKPLINFKPEGVAGGQEIDPDVFHDPVSNKNYLYWGNGYLAVAQLNDDMVSVERSTVKVMTPDASFREGVEVFYRKGKYYFLWSENDTGEPDYRVRYAISDSPTGPLTIPRNNLVIAKDSAKKIFATGHNSVINKPNTDEWYIVYHRFARPHGISFGREAGSHREVCIDRLFFNADGSIAQVTPTLKGVSAD